MPGFAAAQVEEAIPEAVHSQGVVVSAQLLAAAMASFSAGPHLWDGCGSATVCIRSGGVGTCGVCVCGAEGGGGGGARGEVGLFHFFFS